MREAVISLVDDLDGDDADETVRFGLDGVTYEIDLTVEHADELRTELSAYLAAARRTRSQGPGARSAPNGRRVATAATPHRERVQAMRQWVQAEGYPVSDRGRIPAGVVEAYRRRDETRPAAPDPAADAAGRAALRAWARSHGHTVSDRGRIPEAVVEAFRRARREASDTSTVVPIRRRRAEPKPARRAARRAKAQ